MAKGNFVKVSGGIIIMFSVFLFLATSKQIAKNGPEIKTFLLGENEIQTNIVQKQVIPDNVIQGNFKLDTSESNKFIYSTEFKNKNKSPILKVEILKAGQQGWKKIEWHTLNYQESKLYFKLPELEKYYTGRYQLIFN